MSALAQVIGDGELLVIERLAADLETAGSVEEIKDIRDRAMALQLYARKKAGGLVAAQRAGRVFTDATLDLAQMYKDEDSARGKGGVRRKDGRDRDHDHLPGKAAIAQAAEMDHAALSRLLPLLDFTDEQIQLAKVEIESRGDIVTPNSLRVQLTVTSAAEDYDGDEWYTPPEIVERVRTVLGEIDLDPASNAYAQKTVRAKKFYGASDDGLSKPWAGRVFCNPPYSSPLIEQFTIKLLEERPEAAVYLVNNATDVGWFHDALAACALVCFTRGRIAFLNRKGGKLAGTRQGQALFYFGKHRDAFYKTFIEIGAVLSLERSR